MKEKVLETLKKLGFVTIEIDNYHMFEYEGKGYLYSVDDNDDSFLSFAIPNIMNAESDDEEEYDDNFSEMLRVECEVNSKVKYVKALIVKDSLWLACEREVYAEENYEQLVPMMILRLFKAAEFVREEFAKSQLEAELDAAEDDSTDDESTSQQLDDVIDRWFAQLEQRSDDEDSDTCPSIEDDRSDDEDYDEMDFDYEECTDVPTIENENNQ